MGESKKTLRLKLVTSLGPVLKSEWVLTPGKEYIIGRSPESDVLLLDSYVSRYHAKIFYRDGSWWIVDLGSRNGTLVNGKLIPSGEYVRIVNSDVLTLGTTKLRVIE